MDYLVELKVDGSYITNRGKSLFVRVEADSLEEAADKAQDSWGYDAISVGETPDAPSFEFGHSSRGTWRYPVDNITTVTVGGEKL